MDTFLPSAPARVRALVLPVGRIRKERFYMFFELIAHDCTVRLREVTPDPRPDRALFSPLEVPDGYVLYDFMTSAPSNVQLSLSPFELFREPLLVLGIVDAREYDSLEKIQNLTMATLKIFEEDYPRILVCKLLVFHSMPMPDITTSHADAIHIQLHGNPQDMSMRRFMCDITSNLLAEMTTLAVSLKALPSMASPSVTSSGAGMVLGDAMRSFISYQPSVSNGDPTTFLNASYSHRMSMPVLPSNNESDAQSGSPESGTRSPPPRTFDELIGGENSMDNRRNIISSKSRDNCQDRVSISGFGPGSLDERKRDQGKCRISIVISSLYMLAGRWNDALHGFAESAALARSFGDHIWHAKAFENMITCLILLSWAQIPFKIPPICYPSLDRTSSKLAQITSPTSTSSDSPSADISPARKELAFMIPDLIKMVINLYNRSAGNSSECLPQLAYSECIIRLSRIQAGLLLGQGILSSDVLAYLVKGTSFDNRTKPFLDVGKTKIADMVMKAMPGLPEASGLSATDEATILAGIASVLSILGLQRKKAMLLKEYIRALVRAIHEEKRSGAAEAGVHPSASGFAQSALFAPGNSTSVYGLDNFLNMLCQVYGIPETRSYLFDSHILLHDADGEDTNQLGPLLDRLVDDLTLRSFGSVNLKLDVLRACISLWEALPDPYGTLSWTTALLRVANPGSSPSSDVNDVSNPLSREEQLLLSGTMVKTITDAKLIGLRNIDVDYWDEFLVRGVLLIDASPSLTMHSRRKSDLFASETKQTAKQGPFIHNPFLKKPVPNAVQNLLVANEDREFIVTLQNLYEFEIYIESISLLVSGLKCGLSNNQLLRPYRTQSFSILVAIPSPGQYELTSCVVKIRGCREKAFPIFSHIWRPEYSLKLKSIGFLKLHPEDDQTSRNASIASPPISVKDFPKPKTVLLTVLPSQAVLEVISISLPQSSAMLLEGESLTFNVTVQNVSEYVSIDFLHVSFNDSTTAAMEDAISKKNLNSAELYELEYQLAHRPAIRLVGGTPHVIAPNQCCELSFELLGKPGLTQAFIVIDYATLHRPILDARDILYTRQVVQPVSITVNSSVQLQRFDVLPISDAAVLGHARAMTDHQQDHCLLLLDVRNTWPSPLEITIHQEKSNSPELTNTFQNTQELIKPGHIARMTIFIPKLYISNPHARIRSANERQFVLSANSISPETERITRELFWYREALLNMLSVTWKQLDSSKHGVVDLRNTLRLTPRMVDALRLDDLHIQLSIVGGEGVLTDSSGAFKVHVDDYLVLETRVRNRSNVTISPILRLLPSLPHQPPELALDLSKRLAWSGLMQKILQPIAPGETEVSNMAIYVLSSGEYQFDAMVEEIKRMPRSEENSHAETVPDPVTGSAERRVWIASEPCRIVASERD
ncbi:hypothetical protein, variant [Verruconis gallopava]|uniref:Hypercellular protein HypA n=1 Tax=Verruconis gallopava TaxID=253628 RepID=A0A0D1ZYJ6_9PEZI|nr:uncharacterized protein PV09_09179 [Verruconis gallopava]XP_016209020.1 hypothetical protein, variant [Verruconis gallopava]KIV99149.1 hypothetical protein PV09_09179 [Verruconis gallopava]KIV99150.1 hypothetical protein, variant [Verruconis gallopava]